MNIIKNIKDSWKHIPYTIKHYKCFFKTEKRIIGKYKHIFHDLDKVLLYIFVPYFGIEKINNIHRKFNKHHPTFKYKNNIIFKSNLKIDWIEAIIDWECARFTKPDKPLNAYETLTKFYPKYKDYVLKHFSQIFNKILINNI